MSGLYIDDLHASVAGFEILRGVSLHVEAGSVHVVMGPNGCGKSTLAHTIMGRRDYTVTSGSVRIDGEELLGRPTWERARAGLFVAMQYPVEVAGVRVADLVGASTMRGASGDSAGKVAVEAARLGVAESFLERGVNDEFSGGERKRLETLQLAVLDPKFAILDEIDSGLDVDALADVASRVREMVRERNLGVLAITHYANVLAELAPDVVHVMMAGRIVRTGGMEIVEELERAGYEGMAAELGITELTVQQPKAADPFGPTTPLSDLL